jgi:hypothetical protein
LKASLLQYEGRTGKFPEQRRPEMASAADTILGGLDDGG